MTQGFMSPASVPLDIRHIPALVPQHRRNATSFLILDELSYLIKRLQTLLDHHQAPQARTIEDPMSNCTFALWAQLQPFPEGTTQEEVDELERELKKSDGRSTTHLPRPSIEGLAWSQDCGLVLKLKESSGECDCL